MSIKQKVAYIHRNRKIFTDGDNYKDGKLQFDHSFAELDSIELIEELEKLGAKVHKVSEIVPPFNDRTEVTITVYMWKYPMYIGQHIYHATFYQEEGYTETFLYDLTRIKTEAL
tara:strand:+ start:4904 stop:5245 length:342 start_codon:yes stop_codon:yes gene_type:complete